jgi:hypothetical protein
LEPTPPSPPTVEASTASEASTAATSLVTESSSPAVSNSTDGGDDGGECGCEEPDFHSNCLLIQFLISIRVNLTVEMQVEWDAFLREIQNKILRRTDISNDDKVVLCSDALKDFLSVHIEIYKIVSYMKIGDWGLVIDFLYVSISIQIEKAPSICEVDNGSCGLTEGIRNASQNSSPDVQTACESLIVEIIAILEDVSMTYEEKCAALFELITSWCSEHPEMEDFLLNIHIEGFGSIKSFMSVCKTYQRITTVSVVLSGTSRSDCLLLQALVEASQNTSFTENQRNTILQLVVKLEGFFAVNVSLSARLQFVSQQCYQMFALASWEIEIVESVMCGTWGSIYDLIFCSGVCTNNGCGNIDHQITTVAPTTTAAPTTEASTAGSTPQATTKSPAPCDAIGDLCTVDAQNKTVLTTCLTTAYNSWTIFQKSGFNTCFNRIRQAIWNSVKFATMEAKINEIKWALWSYNNNSVSNQQLVTNLTMSCPTWTGTIGQMVSCASCCH